MLVGHLEAQGFDLVGVGLYLVEQVFDDVQGAEGRLDTVVLQQGRGEGITVVMVEDHFAPAV